MWCRPSSFMGGAPGGRVVARATVARGWLRRQLYPAVPANRQGTDRRTGTSVLKRGRALPIARTNMLAPRSLSTKLVLAVAPIVVLAIVALTWIAVSRASDAQREAVAR